MTMKIFTLLPLLTLISSILLTGCFNNTSITTTPMRSLQDVEPPHFENLVFPESGSLLEDGCLLITGTLVDAAGINVSTVDVDYVTTSEVEGEAGFDEEDPVYLEIETLGTDSTILRTIHSSAYRSWDPEGPSFFDFDTGDFAFEFSGNSRRMKPGYYNLRLIGVDASGNQSKPIESIVKVLPLEGVDPQSIYDARTEYGYRLIGVLDSYRNCLEVYGGLYEVDIQVINELIAYFESIYVNSPRMDTWYGHACELQENINEIQYPDPIIRAVLQEGLEQFKEQILLMVELKAGPFYPEGSVGDIVDYQNDIIQRYLGDIFSVENPYQGDPHSYHFYFLAYRFSPDDVDEMTEIADFVVSADPAQSLQVTGTIGFLDLIYYDISPDDYDHPIEVPGLFVGAGLNFHLMKYW